MRPQQCKDIWFCSKHFDGSFKMEIGKIDGNAQWNCFAMIGWIAADLNIWRIEISHIYSALHQILMKTKLKRESIIKITFVHLNYFLFGFVWRHFGDFLSKDQKYIFSRSTQYIAYLTELMAVFVAPEIVLNVSGNVMQKELHPDDWMFNRNNQFHTKKIKLKNFSQENRFGYKLQR